MSIDDGINRAEERLREENEWLRASLRQTVTECDKLRADLQRVDNARVKAETERLVAKARVVYLESALDEADRQLAERRREIEALESAIKRHREAAWGYLRSDPPEHDEALWALLEDKP